MAQASETNPAREAWISGIDDDADASYGPTRRQLILLTATFWVAEFCLSELRSVVDHSVKIQLYTELRLLSAAFGCLECVGIHLLASSAARAGWRHRGVIVVAAAALAGIVNLRAIDWLQDMSAYPVSDFGAGWRIYKASYWAMLFGAWAAIYLALAWNREAVRQERQARRLEGLARDAQLRALRFQVDPHFLFNTFNSVAALMVEGRGAEAETMIERAADFFRMTLVNDPRCDVPLAEELQVQRIYLDIERVRFPDMEVDIDVHPDAEGILVPALLLQPLLENAIKFSRGSDGDAVRLGVTAFSPRDGVMRIEVWDAGQGRTTPSKGTGTGLRNVRERLTGRFGSRADLTIEDREPRGTRVILTFPVA